MAGGWAIDVELRGMPELMRRLKALPRKTANAALRKGCRAGAKIVTAAAKAAVPVVTGRWREALKTRAMKRSRKGVGARTTVGAGWFKGETFYAGFVDWGHRVGKRPSKRIAGTGADTRAQIPPKHYMKRSAKAVGQRAGDDAVRVAVAEIERTAPHG